MTLMNVGCSAIYAFVKEKCLASLYSKDRYRLTSFPKCPT